MTVRGHVFVLGNQFGLFAGIIHVVFIITLCLPLYLFIVFIYFISYVGLFVLWCFNATFNKFSVFSWRGNIDSLTQIHDLSLSWLTRYYSSSSYVIEIRVVCSIVSFLLSVLLCWCSRLSSTGIKLTIEQTTRISMT
jgi:hypothetical protein